MISFIQKNLYTCLVIYIVNIIEFRVEIQRLLGKPLKTPDFMASEDLQMIVGL